MSWKKNLFAFFFIVLFQCVSGWILCTYRVKNSCTTVNPNPGSSWLVFMKPCNPSATSFRFRILSSPANRGRLYLVSSSYGNWDIQDAIHTHVNFLQVVVHVPLDIDVFHLYWRNDYPNPNIFRIATLWKWESAQAHWWHAIFHIGLVALPSLF